MSMRADQAIDCWLQKLYDFGFRRMVVNGLSPLGCLPTEITMRNPKDESRPCVEALNSVSAQYNSKLQAGLAKWSFEGLYGAKIAYGDTYNSFDELLTHPEKYGKLPFSYICSVTNKVPFSNHILHITVHTIFRCHEQNLSRRSNN